MENWIYKRNKGHWKEKNCNIGTLLYLFLISLKVNLVPCFIYKTKYYEIHNIRTKEIYH